MTINSLSEEALADVSVKIDNASVTLLDMKDTERAIKEVIDQFKDQLLSNNLIDETNPFVLRGDKTISTFTYVPEMQGTGLKSFKDVKVDFEVGDICEGCYDKITRPKVRKAHIKRKVVIRDEF